MSKQPSRAVGDESLTSTNARGLDIDQTALRAPVPATDNGSRRAEAGGASAFDPDDDAAEIGDAPRAKRGKIGWAIVAILALIVAAGVFFVGRNMFGPPDQGIKADRFVEAYLETLARGDAAEALKFSPTPPPDSRLLTNEVLAESRNRAPITDIRIVASDQTRVQAEYRLGGKPAVAVFDVEKRDGRWVMPQAWATLEVTEADIRMPFLLNSVKLESPGNYPIFPGSYLVASTTEWVEMDHSIEIYDNNPAVQLGTVALQLTEAGKRDAEVRIRNDLVDRCLASNQLQPKGCPYVIDTKTKGGQDIIPESVSTELKSNNLSSDKVKAQDGSPIAIAKFDFSYTVAGKAKTEDGATADLRTTEYPVKTTVTVAYDQDPPSVGWGTG